MQILSKGRNDYIIDFSIFIDSICVSIDDENCLNCKFFSLEINIEPSLSFNFDYIDNCNFDEFISNYKLYLDDNKSNTKFQTNWFKVKERPLKTTFDVFFDDQHGSIRECIINQNIKGSSILPTWMIDIYTYFYKSLNTLEKFNDFLLSVIQFRITILGYNRSNNIEIFQIGECLTKLDNDQLLSNKNFLFINKICDNSFFININDVNTDNFTIGILKFFFEYIPTISEIKSSPCKKENYSENTNYTFKYRFSEGFSLFGNRNLKYSRISCEKRCDLDYSDFIPLQWEYLDDNGKIRGPYNSITIMSWLIKGYFCDDSKLRLFHVGSNTSDSEFQSAMYREFKPLSEYIELIKSDVSRLFPDSGRGLQYCSSQKINPDNFEKDSYQRSNTIFNKIHNSDRNSVDKYYNYSTKSNNKLFFTKNIEEINLIKKQLRKIEIEFQSKMKKKLPENRLEIDNICNTNHDNKNLSKRDQVIESATRNVFRQKNNCAFKRWCVEFGPELVSDACAIRIQRAFREYKKKKTNLH
ncbi:protein with gyf domain [Cryptosporidium ryanae]|uniref:protein with gyf domain n=1 Tax=Cryptosporidium ryanae TaxID=515981 RepID=UPI00351A569D|nr:protein with gyf domain [Cryptosporidium ryanae]